MCFLLSLSTQIGLTFAGQSNLRCLVWLKDYLIFIDSMIYIGDGRAVHLVRMIQSLCDLIIHYEAYYVYYTGVQTKRQNEEAFCESDQLVCKNTSIFDLFACVS